MIFDISKKKKKHKNNMILYAHVYVVLSEKIETPIIY